MSRSLERHLSRSLALAIVLTGLAAGVASFAFAYIDAQEFQDDTLRQIAALADRQGSGPAFEGDNALHDPESRVIVLRLPSDTGPRWLPAELTAGLHTLTGPDARFRVFVRQMQGNTRIAVAQPTDVRDEIAISSALRTFAPMALLLPLLVWLATRIVRGELAQVRRLSQTLDEQPTERPQPLPDGDVPDEITPFVHAINRLLERVTRLMGEQRRFIADAAHELRSPLTALSVQVQNLEKATSPETMRARIVPLREGIERTRRLTEQLLSLARTQAGNPVKVPLEVSKMVRELIADYLPLAEARGIDLGLEEHGEALVLASEAETLRLVLKNALDNALRYTPPQGEVTLSLYVEGEHAVIDVKDTGPGIPAVARELVFNPFHRLEGTGGEGSGLGLAIAREAAIRLGGAISLHDRREGTGLVFRYTQRRFL